MCGRGGGEGGCWEKNLAKSSQNPSNSNTSNTLVLNKESLKLLG